MFDPNNPDRHSYYCVEVRDDHDGGSIWIIEEDYLDRQDATELAEKLSRTRDNHVARVRRVTAVTVDEWESGNKL
jgi:hypothetical protein